MRSLRHLVAPERVVAVAPVGAAPAWARRLERNLFAPGGDGSTGFAGERLTVGSVGEAAPPGAVVADVEDLAAGPFLALVALPQPDPVGLLERLHARGCRGAVLVGGGLEPLALSPAARRDLQARAKALGVRVLGPTRVGLVLPHLGLNAGAAAAGPPVVAAGDLAFIAQSDAVTTAMLDWAAPRGIGFSLVAALGDSTDVRVDDFLDLLALDPRTRAILLHLEGVEDARRFMSAARAAARVKPVVVLRAGRHAPPGPGDGPDGPALRDEAYDAAFRRAGLLRVRSVEGLFASARTLAHGVAPSSARARLRTGRLAIVSNGRGPALLAADALGAGGGTLARLAPATSQALALALGPVQGHLLNPLDLGLEAGPDALAAALPPLLRDPGCDAVLVLFAPGAVAPPERYAEALAGLGREARERGRLLLAAWLGEATVGAARRALAAARIPAYGTPEEAVRALLDLAAFERRQHALRQVPAAEPLEERPNCVPVRALVRRALAAGHRALGPAELVRLLDAYGLPPPGGTVARGPGIEAVLGMRLDRTFGPVLRLAQGGPGDALIGEAASALPPLNRALAQAMLEETALGRLLLAGGGRELPDPAYLVDAILGLSRLVVDRPEIAAVELELRLSAGAGLETLRAAVGLEPAPAADGDPAARLAVRPYPVELEREVSLRGGRRVRLRPIRPEDAPALRRAFRKMSPEDARLRLFGPARELMPELAARLTQTDYDRELALVAEDPDSPGDLIGGARVVMDADGRRAEFAVTVRSDQKRRGLGRIALDAVLDYARARGVEVVWGSILAENRGMIALARRLGFEVRRDPDEPEAVLAVRHFGEDDRPHASLARP